MSRKTACDPLGRVDMISDRKSEFPGKEEKVIRDLDSTESPEGDSTWRCLTLWPGPRLTKTFLPTLNLAIGLGYSHSDKYLLKASGFSS